MDLQIMQLMATIQMAPMQFDRGSGKMAVSPLLRIFSTPGDTNSHGQILWYKIINFSLHSHSKLLIIWESSQISYYYNILKFQALKHQLQVASNSDEIQILPIINTYIVGFNAPKPRKPPWKLILYQLLIISEASVGNSSHNLRSQIFEFEIFCQNSINAHSYDLLLLKEPPWSIVWHQNLAIFRVWANIIHSKVRSEYVHRSYYEFIHKTHNPFRYSTPMPNQMVQICVQRHHLRWIGFVVERYFRFWGYFHPYHAQGFQEFYNTCLHKRLARAMNTRDMHSKLQQESTRSFTHLKQRFREACSEFRLEFTSYCRPS